MTKTTINGFVGLRVSRSCWMISPITMSKSVSQAVEFSSRKNGLVDIGGDERTVSASEEFADAY